MVGGPPAVSPSNTGTENPPLPGADVFDLNHTTVAIEPEWGWVPIAPA